MTFLHMLLSGMENYERKLNPLPKPVYTYLSGSAFLVTLTPPNKKSFKVK